MVIVGTSLPQAADVFRNTAAGGYGSPPSRGRHRLQTLFAVAGIALQLYAIPQPPTNQNRGNVMAIDFEIPPEAKAIREKVRQWVHDECIPAEKALDDKPLKEVLDPLRKKARAQGLWCPFIPKEYGGMGLGPLANALVQMELGESSLGALSL